MEQVYKLRIQEPGAGRPQVPGYLYYTVKSISNKNKISSLKDVIPISSEFESAWHNNSLHPYAHPTNQQPSEDLPLQGCNSLMKYHLRLQIDGRTDLEYERSLFFYK